MNNNLAGLSGGCFFLENNNHVNVSKSRLTKNVASNNNGGCISMKRNSSITIDHSVLSNNYANVDGGGIYVQRNSNVVSIRASIVINNTAYLGNGGAIHGSATSISNTNFTDNSAMSNGGALYIDVLISNALTITNTEFHNNSAHRSSGGGIHINKTYDKPTAVYLDHSQITSNTAYNDGGFMYSNDSEINVIVLKSTLKENKI